MKIVLVGSLTVGSSDVPLLLKRALEQEGHQVEMFLTDDQLSPKETALIRAGRRWTPAFYQAFSRRLLKRLLKVKPDLLFICQSNWGILPGMLQEIKRRLHVCVIIWEGNLLIWEDFQAASLKHYDHVFVADSYVIPLLKGPAQLSSVHHLVGGCDPDIHRPLTPTAAEQADLGAEVCFVGWGYPNRREMVEHLAEYRLKLWGLGWDESPALQPFYRDETVYGLKKTKIYNASKIMLNLQSTRWQVHGVSCRPFEVLACGGFCLSENKPDLRKFFELDQEIVAFDDFEDLKQKVDYFLRHEDERKAIAANGRKKVLENYTYRHVVRRILEVINHS